jgi:hypothetical protein
MEDFRDINAAWANKVATTQLGEIAQKQLKEILAKIKLEASKNAFNISICSLEDINRKELVNRGFNVKYTNGDPKDQREQGYYTISW